MRDAVGHTLQPEQIWQWDMGSAMVMHAPWHPAKCHGAAEPWQPRWCHGDACTVACTVPCAYSCRGSVDVPWHNYAMVHSNVAMGHHKYTHGTSVPWHIMTHGVIIVFHGTQVGRRGTSVLVAQSMPRYNIVLWHNVYRGAFFVPWVKYGVL